MVALVDLVSINLGQRNFLFLFPSSKQSVLGYNWSKCYEEEIDCSTLNKTSLWTPLPVLPRLWGYRWKGCRKQLKTKRWEEMKWNTVLWIWCGCHTHELTVLCYLHRSCLPKWQLKRGYAFLALLPIKTCWHVIATERKWIILFCWCPTLIILFQWMATRPCTYWKINWT